MKIVIKRGNPKLSENFRSQDSNKCGNLHRNEFSFAGIIHCAAETNCCRRFIKRSLQVSMETGDLNGENTIRGKVVNGKSH